MFVYDGYKMIALILGLISFVNFSASCSNNLGIADGTITDSQMTSSSNYGSYRASEGRLHGSSAWSAGTTNTNQWIQVDLGSIKQVTRVATQGKWNERMTEYKVKYRNDAGNFIAITTQSGGEVFPGNSNEDTVVTNSFSSSVNAQYIRIYTHDYRTWPTLRMELYGCAVDHCSPNPCQNAGVCSQSGASFTCQCTSGYEGNTCQTLSDLCSPNPCQNSGVCSQSGASFTCQCTSGYEGNTCQTLSDLCSPNPCQNSGVCSQSGASFTCQCTSGYEGNTCQTLSDLCSPNPCQNAGVCSQSGASFTCQCTSGYEGDICETSVNFCGSNPCQNSAVCTSTEGGFTCTCPSWFTGDTCQIQVPDVCLDQLGIEDGTIPIENITVSSVHSPSLEVEYSRLNSQEGGGSWSSASLDQDQWIQTDLGDTKQITGVMTQGRHGFNQYVKTFHISYSMDGVNFELYDDTNCNAVVFTANSDITTVVNNTFPRPIYTQFIRINPLTWFDYISMRFEILGCSGTCSSQLGIEDGTVPIEQITVSSQHSAALSVQYSRLNSQSNSWCAQHNNQDQWIQVDLGEITQVNGVITQGRHNQYVTTYHILYSLDGSNFDLYLDDSCNALTFDGNVNWNTAKTTLFPNPIYARVIRINPRSYVGYTCIRFDILGCPVNYCDPNPCQNSAECSQIFGGFTCICQSGFTGENCEIQAPCPSQLGIEDGTIPVEQITVSSQYSASLSVQYSRLNSQEGGGSWSAASLDQEQWIQTDLSGMKQITGVITQGRRNSIQYVKTFHISSSLDGVNFDIFVDDSCDVMVFTGNSDTSTAVTNMFPRAIYAQFIRILPLTWNSYISMRFEILGCVDISEMENATNPVCVECDDGWLLYEDSCYYVHNGVEIYTDGENICNELDAGLVVINNAEEQTFVYSQINARFFIALHDRNIEGFFEWMVDYSPWSDYTPFGSGEPNNAGGNENCIENHVAWFNDYPCTFPKHICCEYAPYLKQDPTDVSIVYDRPLNLVILTNPELNNEIHNIMRCYILSRDSSNVFIGTLLSLTSYSTKDLEILPSSSNGQNSDLPDDTIATFPYQYQRKLTINPNLPRGGEYNCRLEMNGQSTTVHSIVLNEGAEIDVNPNERTVTIGLGETITLNVESLDTENLRWRHNSKFLYGKGINSNKLIIKNARREDEGVYECYYLGRRHELKHTYMFLYVTECPTSYCGIPSCALNCPVCYNGGRCHARSCTCICPPGFLGQFCEEGTLDSYGMDEYRSFNSQHFMCAPSPIGCSCFPGQTGMTCLQECVAPMYGSNCQQTCNCDITTCDKTFGCNDTSACFPGFTGPSCQDYEADTPCPVGFFGEQCHKKCHCHNQANCHKFNGTCENGCETGWAGEGCQTVLPALYDTPWVEAREANSAIVSWNRWNNEHDFGLGPIINYRVYLWDTWYPEEGQTPALVGVINGTSWEVTGLQPNLPYSVMIRATKKVGTLIVAGKPGPVLWIPEYDQCDTNWIAFDDQCIHINNTLMSWNEGDVYCKTRQSQLIHFSSVNIKNFILHTLESQPLDSNQLLMGMRKDINDLYIWDGYNFAIIAGTVDPPDMHFNLTSEDVDCTVINLEDDFSRENIACDDYMGIPICQKGNSPPRMHPIGSSFYYISENQMTWQQAKQFCDISGGYLAVISSAEENTDVLQLLQQHGEDSLSEVCIGYELQQLGNVSEWVGTSEWSEYKNFMTSNTGIGGACVSMNATNGQWRHFPCDTPLHFLCEISYVEFLSVGVSKSDLPQLLNLPTVNANQLTWDAWTTDVDLGEGPVDNYRIVLYSWSNGLDDYTVIGQTTTTSFDVTQYITRVDDPAFGVLVGKRIRPFQVLYEVLYKNIFCCNKTLLNIEDIFDYILNVFYCGNLISKQRNSIEDAYVFVFLYF
ncbi:uncharacterized protein [Antedon mediterranea]|uniref:uncharacterized protein n=1 Tax=Antedon mediterranea TaxID=105859 RepID=UPI003AF8314F